MSSLQDYIMHNKDEIERGIETLGQAFGVLASSVGQLHPLLEFVFKATAELLKDPEGDEACYLSQQLQQVNQKLERVQDEQNEIDRELKRSSMNKQNFEREARILSQYEKLQEFLNSKQRGDAKKMELFLKLYENTKRDLSLEGLYHAVAGQNAMKEAMLETFVYTAQRDRRAVEGFCAGLKGLFVKGIIVVLAYGALTEGVGREETLKKWQDRMEDVEKRMTAAVDDCAENFTAQAEQDVQRWSREDAGTAERGLPRALLDELVKKYDWVNWSVRAFRDREKFCFFDWLAGDKYHGIVGDNSFEFLTDRAIRVVVSFCVDPQPIDKGQIREQIKRQSLKGNMKAVAQALNISFPDCLVHAVSYYKEVAEANNFNPDCYDFGKHNGAFVCIHPKQNTAKV